ncbi:hypothetical protein BpHYR1_013036 [Brachionus plicatilis]|uniref:Uncharacterized protein n=1 Tax=Brachionus plicatilis TaxID=10195 RepID=A0A3M7SIW7_BRAPC|nr:hypothetical protein BpHYR1_013036 [Brachionus plicatilis]
MKLISSQSEKKEKNAIEIFCCAKINQNLVIDFDIIQVINEILLTQVSCRHLSLATKLASFVKSANNATVNLKRIGTS